MPSPPPPPLEDWIAQLAESLKVIEDYQQKDRGEYRKANAVTRDQLEVIVARLDALEHRGLGWDKARLVVLVGDPDFSAVGLRELAKSNSQSIAANAGAINELQEDLGTLTRRIGAVQHLADFQQRLAYANIGMTAVVLFVLLLLTLQVL